MKYQQIPKPIENSPGETFLFKAGTNISAGFTQIWGIYHGHPPNDNMETILNKGPDGSVSFTVKDLNHPIVLDSHLEAHI